MLKQLNWTTLEERRKRACLTTLYKYNQGHIFIETEHAPKLQRPSYSTRHSHEHQYAMESCSRIPVPEPTGNTPSSHAPPRSSTDLIWA